MIYKVLLVEDNENLGYILKEYLAMKSFHIDWVTSGSSAKIFLKSNKPNLITKLPSFFFTSIWTIFWLL